MLDWPWRGLPVLRPCPRSSLGEIGDVVPRSVRPRRGLASCPRACVASHASFSSAKRASSGCSPIPGPQVQRHCPPLPPRRPQSRRCWRPSSLVLDWAARGEVRWRVRVAPVRATAASPPPHPGLAGPSTSQVSAIRLAASSTQAKRCRQCLRRWRPQSRTWLYSSPLAGPGEVSDWTSVATG